nr:hemerythrin domain-containing protein [Acanthopleuribacter pedis]
MAEVRARIKSGEDGPVPTFETGQVAPLIDYILDRFHAGHRRDFEALVQMAGKVWEVHGAKWPRMGVLSQLIDHLIKDICPHMLKEEQILFPMMLTQDQGRQGPVMCPSGGPAGPIAVMRKEHENVGELLASLAVVTDQFTPPTWACPTFRSMFALLKQLSEEIRLHVHLENNVLFPMAAKGKSNVPGG